MSAVTSPLEVDVAVVGGGMVGASLAASLAGTGVRILLIEAVPFGSGAQPSFDDRTTALGNASRRIFEALGVWPDIAPEAAAIRAIHVSDAGRFGAAHLSAEQQGVAALGYVVPNRRIGAALWGRLGRLPDITLRVPGEIREVAIDAAGVRMTVESGGRREAVAARLVVAADGAHSQIRAAAGIAATVEDYDQVAVVANVASDTPHEGNAYERFTPAGPLAVLPLADGSLGAIWACRSADAPAVLALDEAAWLATLQARFGWRAGRFTRAGRRASYPLKLSRAAAPVATRTVLIGNAAQALHPVAGQGFNLGLRDAAMLAEVLANAAGDPGAPELLARFAAWRGGDRGGVVRFTDGLVKLFGDTRPGVGLLRNLGLLAFDLTPPAKSALARISLGFGGPSPRLARGLPVRHA
ncbi:MAG TPA: 2-octaprenyl-6-methoxyphenyl hydroxylase [Steroidobacteraceae bacterium]|nr:2-octaprenyl-6-methoxyphenyl hydroxylase [Steroidobacteraceae bacterium]